MSTDLEQQLRDSGAGTTLARPVDDILDRGDRIRRRRTRGIAAGVGAAAAVAALATTVVLPPGSNPVITPAVASWAGGETNLSADQLEKVNDACLGNQELPGGTPGGRTIPEDTLPLAAELRGGIVLAYYRYDDLEVTCKADVAPGGAISPGALLQSDNYKPLPADVHLSRTIGFGASDPGLMGGPVTDIWTVGRVSPDVARVTAEIGGDVYEGSVVNGSAFFWADGQFPAKQVDEAVITAFDANGEVLARVDHLTGTNDPQGPNDDSHL